ncbi:MAG TPA: DnaB-like helicase C-terminal domain-containing protein [Intrasporangium sp.]|nr:DnaB-like helicase C-terminal domain-containing protein [Intrasporangium sp.]
MDRQLIDLARLIERTDAQLSADSPGEARVWPTGFDVLDRAVGGGLRSGGLALLAGPQGLGKTTFALQLARNVAHDGRSVIYFSYEHDPEDLMQRLVTLEAALMHGPGSTGIEQVRAAFEDTEVSASLDQRLADLPGAVEGLKMVTSYAERLHLHRSSGATTDLAVIERAVETVFDETRQAPLVIVDYLQKVKVPGPPMSEEDRSSVVVEGLKDYALDAGVPILAIAASNQTGVEAGKRMRISHLRGSSSLGYEADIVLILNNKYDIVARHHLVYDVGHAERFRQWAVLSLEKNRSGRGGIDLEFRKRFDQCRFDIDGQVVSEQLIDERIFTE